MFKSIGNLDFVVKHNQSIVLIGWLEPGEETKTRIFLRSTAGIKIMPEKIGWYFREDVNETLNLEDEENRGLFLTFPEHSLQNKEFDFVVQSNGTDVMKHRITPDKVKEMDSIPDTAAGFVQETLKKSSTIDYTFYERIEFIADRFFWCNDSIFVVGGAVDSGRYDRKSNNFTFVYGKMSLSPLDVIYLERNRTDYLNSEDKRVLDDYLLIFECIPEAFNSECGSGQLQLQNYHNLGYATVFPDLGASEVEKAEFLLSYIDSESRHLVSTFDQGIGPALDGLWDKVYSCDSNKIESFTFGVSPEKPLLSIIIPLYGRIDFVMYQLAVLANDDEFLNLVELIYVLDDPNHFDTILAYMEAQQRLYRVPFRLVRYTKNLGYAKANNIGARYATADTLVLMNSDVIPKTTNWVSTCIDQITKLENMGAAGIKLLYEDSSIQHQGMTFERKPFLDNAWANVHPGKNLPDTGKYKKAATVPAVTGAFFITPKAIYKTLGGLDEGYVLGDFEDSDYCLKCYEKGYLIYYLPQIEMYHLERQSQSALDNRKVVTFFNCWRHTHRWNDVIEKVMKGFRDGI